MFPHISYNKRWEKEKILNIEQYKAEVFTF